MNHNQIIEAWNAQSDVQNQWYVLGEDEKVEFAFSLGAGNLDRANALLRQALGALVESRDDVLLCFEHDKQFAGHERYDKRIAFYKEQLAKHDASIAAIKQHLRDV